MAIDKALNQAPLGLDQTQFEEGPGLEIEIEDPESVEIGIDGQPLLRIEEEEPTDEDFDASLAEYMLESELQKLSSELITEYGLMTLGFRRIYGLADSANEGSKKLMLKAGYEYEGLLQKHVTRRDGTQIDMALFAATKN